jgi:hypothetical protein
MQQPSDVSFNFTLLKGEVSPYPCTDLQLQEVRIPEGATVSVIRLREFNESWHPDMYGDLDRKQAMF